MTLSEIKQVKEVLGTLKDFEKLLDERIVDFHEVKGMVQARHAYQYYRTFVYDTQRSLRDLIQRAVDETTESHD